MTSTEQGVRRASNAQHASVLVFGTALATISSAIIPLVVVRVLGKADVASLLALMLVYDTVALLFTWGFPQTVMYQLATHDIQVRRSIAYRSIGLLFASGCAAGLTLVAVGLFGDTALENIVGERATSLEPLLVYAALPLADLPSRLLPNLLVAEGRSRPVAALGVLRALTNSLAVLIPVSLGFGVWAVAACFVAVGFIRGPLSIFYVLRLLYKDVPTAPCPVARKELWRFALPLGATDIVAMLNQQLDRYLILLSFPAASFALYQAGSWQVPIINDIPYQVGTAYAPRLAELFKKGQPGEAVALWGKTVQKVSLLVLPVMSVFILAAEEVVVLLFTADYLGAAPVFRLYSILTLGRVAAYGTMIVAAGRPELVLRAAMLSFGSNLLLSVPLVFALGFLGPALGTVLAFLPTVVFYCWCIGRASTIPTAQVFPVRSFLKVLLVSAVAAVPAALLKWTTEIHPAATLLASAGLTLGSFAALGSLLGLITSEDWRFLRSRLPGRPAVQQ